MIERETSNTFHLASKYEPAGDQPAAIAELVDGVKGGEKAQILLGATGTGKTFTISNVIQEVNKPTLVIAHNKTLAGQLYGEFKEFFPDNAVEYLSVTMIIINQKHMYPQVIHILKKIPVLMMKLINYAIQRQVLYWNETMSSW